MNARGSPADITRLATINTSSSDLTGRRPGSSQLVTQVVYAHASHTIPNSTSVCSAPWIVAWASRKTDSCVTANT